MKTIGIVIGTRPEAIKLLPLYFALKKSSEFHVVMISTGQHKEMLDQVLNFYNISPDYSFNIMADNQSLGDLSARLLLEFTALFNKLNLDLVFVQGDTTSAFIGGLSAYYHKIPVAHLEAGLRTGDIYSPFPEEVNRKAISTLSTLNYAPTQSSADILQSEGVHHIEAVGNTVIDSLIICREHIRKSESRYRAKFSYLFEGSNKLVAVTAHRREHFGEGLIEICSAIKKLSQEHQDIHFAFPVHMNPSVNGKVRSELSSLNNVHLMEPLAYDEWVFIMSESLLILTDSGGVQEEAPALNIPVIVMRDKTERPEGVQSGSAVLAGKSSIHIINTFNKIFYDKELLNKMRTSVNPYGDGHSAQKILKSLTSYFGIN